MRGPARVPGRKAVAEVVWVLAGQAGTVAGSLALLRLLTTLMSPEEYGRLALGLTLAGLVGQTVTGGLANALGRFRSIAVEAGDLDGFLSASRTLALRAAGWILIGGALLTVCLYLAGRSDWAWLSAWTVPFAVLSGWSSMLAALQAAARRRAVVASCAALEQWLRLPLAWALSLAFGAGAPTVIAAFAAASGVAVVIQRGLVRETPPDRPPSEREWKGRITAFARPFSMFGPFTWLQQSSDRWSLETFARTRDVGAYAVLFQIGYAPIAMVSGLAMAVLGPVLYQRAGEADSIERMRHVRTVVDRLCLGILAVTSLGVVAAAVFHRPIFALLVGPEFRDVSSSLAWLFAAGGLFAAGQVLSIGIMAEVEPHRLLVPKIATALVGTALNVVGALWAGVAGVAVASAIFGLVYLIWIAILSRRPAA